MIAVVARRILRFDWARAERAGCGADRAVQQSDNHERGCCEFRADCGGRRHVVNYIIVQRGAKIGRQQRVTRQTRPRWAGDEGSRVPANTSGTEA